MPSWQRDPRGPLPGRREHPHALLQPRGAPRQAGSDRGIRLHLAAELVPRVGRAGKGHVQLHVPRSGAAASSAEVAGVRLHRSGRTRSAEYREEMMHSARWIRASGLTDDKESRMHLRHFRSFGAMLGCATALLTLPASVWAASAADDAFSAMRVRRIAPPVPAGKLVLHATDGRS